jgi:hypothetical protein
MGLDSVFSKLASDADAVNYSCSPTLITRLGH